jgi:hypothetical protein
MDSVDFPPPRQPGQNLHAGLILALALITGVFAYLIYRRPISPLLTLYLVIGGAALILLPLLVYRFYALSRSNYHLDRDRLTLKWGLRMEQIPISEIEWIRPMASLAGVVPLPFFSIPGAVLGVRRQTDLGQVEYMASDPHSLLLVAASGKVFAISPEDPSTFLEDVQRAMEMGSLTPAASHSVYPSFVVLQAWESLLARFLWLAGLFLNIGLLAWISLMEPTLGKVSLGFLPSGQPRPPSPGPWIMLLPVVSLVFFLAGWIAGLLTYRRPDHRPMAFILWASGVLSSFLFLLAVLFILTTPV